MKDFGVASKILDMKILKDIEACSIILSQKQYVEKVLFRFEMKNTKPVTTPLTNHFKLSDS